MARQKKPRVITRCVANTYASPNERIIEFSFPDGTGGLISFTSARTGSPVNTPNVVSVYNADPSISVFNPRKK